MSDDADQHIGLDQFLKLNSLAETGGHAKLLIQNGEVVVNGELETRRRRKLRIGDVVEVNGESFTVASDEYGSFFASATEQ